MKTILVLTDFSVPAENAAQYALNFAKILKTDILLCNAYKVPAEAPMAAQVAWPLMNSSEIKAGVYSELDKLVTELSNPSCQTDADTYCPSVTFKGFEGNVCEVASKVVKERKIELVVMGMAGAGGLTQLLLGSNTKEMIEKADFPLLLIPYKAEFKGIKKIAFATNLSKDDVRLLKILAGFAAALDAEIIIIHVSNKEVGSKDKLQIKIDEFLKEVTRNIDFSKIKYEYVWNIDVNSGLEWIAEQNSIDMVAMSHHKHNLIETIFLGSHTQKLSRHIQIPLMVFPSHMPD